MIDIKRYEKLLKIESQNCLTKKDFKLFVLFFRCLFLISIINIGSLFSLFILTFCFFLFNTENNLFMLKKDYKDIKESKVENFILLFIISAACNLFFIAINILFDEFNFIYFNSISCLLLVIFNYLILDDRIQEISNRLNKLTNHNKKERTEKLIGKMKNELKNSINNTSDLTFYHYLIQNNPEPLDYFKKELDIIESEFLKEKNYNSIENGFIEEAQMKNKIDGYILVENN